MTRKTNYLEPRWDVALDKLGKEIEDFLPGEIIFKNTDTIIDILMFSKGMVDIFEVAHQNIQGITINKGKIPELVDFFKLERVGSRYFTPDGEQLDIDDNRENLIENQFNI